MRFRFKYACRGNSASIGCIDKFLPSVLHSVWWKILIMFLISESSCILWWWEGGGGGGGQNNRTWSLWVIWFCSKLEPLIYFFCTFKSRFNELLVSNYFICCSWLWSWIRLTCFLVVVKMPWCSPLTYVMINQPSNLETFISSF